jgi:hypothetical protein
LNYLIYNNNVICVSVENLDNHGVKLFPRQVKH